MNTVYLYSKAKLNYWWKIAPKAEIVLFLATILVGVVTSTNSFWGLLCAIAFVGAVLLWFIRHPKKEKPEEAPDEFE